jgi:flagellar export protein FliJ
MALKFSLQSVLDYRHKRVEGLEVELGQLLSGLRQAQAFLERLHEFRAGLFEQLDRSLRGADSANGEMDLGAIGQMRSNLKLVEARIRQQNDHIRQLQAAVDAKRMEVVAAKQDEETLMTLKNKEIERYNAELLRAENRLVDDIYISQAHRRSAVHF